MDTSDPQHLNLETRHSRHSVLLDLTPPWWQHGRDRRRIALAISLLVNDPHLGVLAIHISVSKLEVEAYCLDSGLDGKASRIMEPTAEVQERIMDKVRARLGGSELLAHATGAHDLALLLNRLTLKHAGGVAYKDMTLHECEALTAFASDLYDQLFTDPFKL